MSSAMSLLLLALATAPLLASAHVKMFFDPAQGATDNELSIRNAGSRTGDGRMSVAGPCGGVNDFGANGIHMTAQGTRMTLKINYNGGHRSDANEFHAIYKCTADGPTQTEMKQIADDATMNDEMTLTLLDGTDPEPKTDKPNYIDASTGNQVTGGYNLVFNIPSTMMGQCTIAVLDQRDWGGCVDLNVQAATTQPPGNTLQTTTQAPVQGASLVGMYRTVQQSCLMNFPTCCCLEGMFEVQHNPAAGTALESMLNLVTSDAHDRTCLNLANALPTSAFHHNASVMPRDVLSMQAMGVVGLQAEGGAQDYSYRVQPTRIDFTNVATDAPRYCDGFAVRITELGLQVEQTADLYNEAEEKVAMYLNTTLNTRELRSMFRSAVAEMSMHYNALMVLQNTATSDELEFAGNMTNRSMSYQNLASSASALESSLPSDSIDEGSDTAGIVVGCVVVVALVALAVVFREKISDTLGFSESGNSRESVVMIEHEATAANVTPTPAARPPPPRPAPRLNINNSYEAV